MVTTTYREQFEGREAAQRYEQHYCAPTYSNVLWEVEKDLLTKIIRDFRSTHDRIEYLDFAAGTGRVIDFVEEQVDAATGIEISSSMAEIAQNKLSKGRMIVKDITSGEDEIEGKYDVITTFRFILNAEPKLRRAGIEALVRRLRDDDSILIFNNHGDLFSLKAIAWPYHKIKALGKGYQTEGNYLTHGEVRRLARDTGLTIVYSVSYGVLSNKLMKVFGAGLTTRLEKMIVRIPILRSFGINRLYVATKAPPNAL